MMCDRKGMDAKAFLSQVERMDCEIRNKKIEKAQWMELGRGVSGRVDGDRVTASSGRGCVELAGVNLGDLAAEIDRRVAVMAAERLRIIRTIEGLDSAKEYELLHLRYIQGVPLKDIADRWGWDYSRVTTMHGRALRHVQALLEKEN